MAVRMASYEGKATQGLARQGQAFWLSEVKWGWFSGRSQTQLWFPLQAFANRRVGDNFMKEANVLILSTRVPRSLFNASSARTASVKVEGLQQLSPAGG